jgi:uncharacterized LabA/DUF88 family protein
VDRCALFVDAGYVLADGAMAVHGTRRRASVSWDYAGLIKLLNALARDRTGLPVLRCYWYEAAVEGRRTDEHNAIADLPGVKLRLGRVRPGRREGVEAEMHRDLAALARNRAVSDAIVVSADEDLADVVAEVQDLGLRVVVVHVAADGSWTASGPLRQECDDLVEVSAAHLRPFVDLIAAAEPADQQEQYRNGSYQQPAAMANGHGGLGAMTHQGLPAAALPPAPQIYTTPVVEDYQRSSSGSGRAPAQTGPAQQPQAAAPQQAPGDVPGAQGQAGSPQERPRPQPDGPARPPAAVQSPAFAQAQAPPAQPQAAAQPQVSPQHQPPAQPAPVSYALAAPPQDLPPAPAPGSALAGPQPVAQQAAALAGAQAPGAGEQHVPEAPQPQAPPRPQPQPPVPVQPAQQAPAAVQLQPAQPHTPSHAQRGQSAQVPAQGAAPAAAQPQALRPAHAAPPQGQLAGRQDAAAAQPLAAPTPPADYRPVADTSWPPQQAGAGTGRQGTPGPQQPQAAQGGTRFAPGQGDYRSPDQMGSAHGRFGELPAAQRFDGPSHARFGELPPPQGRFADSVPPGRYAEAPGAGRYAESPGQSRFAEGPPAARYGDAPPEYQPAQPGAFGPGQAPYPPEYPGPQPGQQTGPGPEPRYPQPSREQAPYSGPQTAADVALPQPVSQPMAMSLSDATAAAHAEGFGFGDAVARDAPALWLEAVLARKPRMPSDLEARLLQGSALPIDSLLHDEVRHSLRRGFWDALERSRR